MKWRKQILKTDMKAKHKRMELFHVKLSVPANANELWNILVDIGKKETIAMNCFSVYIISMISKEVRIKVFYLT